MNFNQIKKILRVALRQIEIETLTENPEISEEELKEFLLQSKKIILEKHGVDPEEFLDYENSLKEHGKEKGKKNKEKLFNDILERIEIISDDRIKDLAKKVIPAPVYTHETKVIKEIIKEKPIITNKVIRETIRENDNTKLEELKSDLLFLQEKFQDFKIPEIPNYELLKKDLEKYSADHISGLWGTLPDYRAALMGLRGDIDNISNRLPGTYLSLDQTTPQTVTGGTPLFSRGIEANDVSTFNGEINVGYKSGYFITAAPLTQSGIDYDSDINGSANSSSFVYASISNSGAALIPVTKIIEPVFINTITGLNNIGVTLITAPDGLGGDLHITFYFVGNIWIGQTNPSPGTDDLLYVDTWLTSVGAPAGCTIDYYQQNIFTSNGVGNAYTWANPDSKTVMSGFTNPPTITYSSVQSNFVTLNYQGVNVENGAFYSYNGSPMIYADTTKMNVFFGGAGNLTMTGENNLAMSQNALQFNDTGEWNTAIGANALGLNSTGSWNTAIGKQTLNSNISGSNNIAIGDSALLHNVISSLNVAIGNYALSESKGQSNVALGSEAGRTLVTGNNNLFIGNDADVTATGTAVNNAIAIGNGILVGADFAQAWGGQGNLVDGVGSVAISGVSNTNHGYYSNILSGTGNTIGALSTYSTILGGYSNTISGGLIGLILGGGNNTASGDGSTILTSQYSTSSGYGSTIIASVMSVASGYGSFLANTAYVNATGLNSAAYSATLSNLSNYSVAFYSQYVNGTGSFNNFYSSLFSNASGNYDTIFGYGLNVTSNNTFAIGLNSFELGTIGTPSFTGTGTNDLAIYPTSVWYATDTGTVVYTVEVSGNTGGVDYIKVKKGAGAFGTPVAMNNTTGVSIGDGITVIFGATSGHTVGDYWTITVTVNTRTTVNAPNSFQLNWYSDYLRIYEETIELDVGGGTIIDLPFPNITVPAGVLGANIMGLEANPAVINRDTSDSSFGINKYSIIDYNSTAKTVKVVDFGIYLDGTGNPNSYTSSDFIAFNPDTGGVNQYKKITAGRMSMIVDDNDTSSHQDIELFALGGTGGFIDPAINVPIFRFYNSTLGNDGGAAFYGNILIAAPTGTNQAVLSFLNQGTTNGASITADFVGNTYYVDWPWSPDTDDTYDLGDINHRWQDGHLSGTLYTNSAIIGYGVDGQDYTLTFNGNANDGVIKWMEDENWFDFNRPLRTSTSLYRRYYHISLASANPGASGATWINPDANTTGGWNITSASHILEGQTDIHSDWDGTSDPKFEVRFATNVDNTGGGVGDTVDLKIIFYYKGVGDTATKSQTVEVATVIGQAPRYKQFKAEFTLNYDQVGNILDAGDVIGFKLNLETDTSEVDNIILSDMSFSYLKTHVGLEDGDE